MDKKEIIKEWVIGCSIGIALMASIAALLYFGGVKKYDSRWYYNVSERSGRYSFEYLGTMTEKDKPTLHKIRVECCLCPTIYVSDEIYNEWYKDYNTITVTTYTLDAKELVKRGFDSIRSENIVSKERILYPYTTDVAQFTEEDLRYFIEAEEYSWLTFDETEAKDYAEFEKEFPEYKRFE